MKLLIFSDIHSDARALERLMGIEADYYFSAGDLVNWARGSRCHGRNPQTPRRSRVRDSGNHESAQQISGFCAKFGFHDFHGGRVKIGDFEVVGLGYSNPTPFRHTRRILRRRTGHPAAIEFDGIKPMIAICHAPPMGHDAGPHHEFEARRFAVRCGNFWNASSPASFSARHIHEAAGAQEKLGVTSAMNVGKKGYLLDLDKQAELGFILKWRL